MGSKVLMIINRPPQHGHGRSRLMWPALDARHAAPWAWKISATSRFKYNHWTAVFLLSGSGTQRTYDFRSVFWNRVLSTSASGAKRSHAARQNHPACAAHSNRRPGASTSDCVDRKCCRKKNHVVPRAARLRAIKAETHKEKWPASRKGIGPKFCSCRRTEECPA